MSQVVAGRRWEWVARCVVYVGVPLVLLGMALGRWVEQAVATRAAAAQESLWRAVQRIYGDSDPPTVLARLLARLDKIDCRTAQGRAALVHAKARLSARFPGVMRFTVVDGDGNPRVDLCDGQPPRALLRKLIEACRELVAGRSVLWERQRSMLTAFVGRASAVEAPFARVLPAQSSGVGAFVYLSRPGPGGMFVVHFDKGANWDLLIVRDRIRRHGAGSLGLRAAVVDLGRWHATTAAQLGVSAADLARMMHDLATRHVRVLEDAQRYWAMMPIGLNHALIATCRRPDPAPLLAAKVWAHGLLLVIWVVILVVGERRGWVMVGGRLPVAVRLTLLFGFAAGLPSLLTVQLALTYLNDHRQSREAGVHQEHENMLRGFDLQFRRYVAGLGDRLKASLVDCVISERDPLASVRNKIGAMITRWTPDDLEIFDENGRRVVATSTSRASGAGDLIFFDWSGVTRSTIRTLNADTSGAERLTGVAGPVASFGPMADMEASLRMILQRIGEAGELQMGTGKAFFFAWPLTDRNNCIRYLLMMQWSEATMARIFLRDNLLQLQRRLADTHVVAVARADPSRDVPCRPRAVWLTRVVQRLQQQSGRFWTRLPGDVESRLVTAIRATRLSGYDLAAVTGDRALRSEHRELQQWLGGAVTLLCVLALAGGTWLGRRVLRPIGVLAEGVTAIQRRDFRWRGEAMGDDELGALTTAFNAMVEGMEDLEVGRIVQESLFPRTSLEFAGGGVAGSCVSASRMGGDYYDYFVNPDGRVAILVGDVAGHGVAAALVMGMAKALLAHPGTPREPAAALAVLHQVLSATLGRRGSMTLVFALFEPLTGNMTWSNAGQAWPLLIRQGRPTFLDLSGQPLAASSRSRHGVRQLDLVAGDRVVFYTDGLPESPLPSGQPIGYAHWAEQVPALVGATPGDTIGNIRTWHRRIVGATPQSDDITLCVLHVDQIMNAE